MNKEETKIIELLTEIITRLKRIEKELKKDKK